MRDVIGIAWFEDKATYDRALTIFSDPANLPASFQDWRSLVERECKLIRYTGNVVLRVDIDLETFADWCASRGFVPDSKGRIAFVDHAVLEYQKTGKGTIVE